CSWPVFEARDHLSAAAQNPGTCVYYTEMWEAVLMDPKQASTSHNCYGDFSGMRY
ncbi:MAG: GMP synthase, partial [Desulfovibrionaceae bacterium]|nr:GMP synthase [Desulfovibrionaceae bacterium]